jgi:hypothetical protein
VLLVVATIATGSSSSWAAIETARSSSSDKVPASAFCVLYRHDANNGRLRNWDLNGNAKTPSYARTLRALARAAPPRLKPDVMRILSYYASRQSHLSAAEGLTALGSGRRVLAYVQHVCGIDTDASPPPGDASTPAP